MTNLSGASAPAERQPGNHWIQVPLAKGRTLYAHPVTLQRKGVKVSTHYSELYDADDEEPEPESKSEENPPVQDVVELSSGSEQETKWKPAITAAEKAKLHLVKTKLPKLPDTSQLIALKQRQRGVIESIIHALGDCHVHPWPVSDQSLKDVTTFKQMEKQLGMKEVSTPASGNCMTMTIAQAISNQSLAAKPHVMEKMTAAIKRGICWAGQLNCMEQFDHFTRTTTLVNMGRGWDGMDPKESSKQFRWYLQEYAASPSKIHDIVPRHNWGSSELMAIAANFLRRRIFVVAFDTDDKNLWYCSEYRPSSMTRGRKIFETGQQIPLQIHECLQRIRQAKLDESRQTTCSTFLGQTLLSIHSLGTSNNTGHGRILKNEQSH